MSLIPPIGSTGIFKVNAPFNDTIKDTINHTCVAIRRLSDLLNSGLDPFNDYYFLNGLTEEKYKEDITDNVCIVSLQTANGNWFYVPSSFIISYPIVGGVAYNSIALMLNIGAIPDALNISFLRNTLVDMTESIIGIRPTIYTVATAEQTMVNEQAHDLAEMARLSKITKTTTDYSELIKVRNENTELKNKISTLEAYIKEKYLNP